MKINHTLGRSDLALLAAEAMIERGLAPEFPLSVLQELEQLSPPTGVEDPLVKNLMSLDWCSIDNDDSRDLDQLTFCQLQADGAFIAWVAVADVDVLVPKGSAIDAHALHNTSSVYTSARIFPMLPDRLSTDLTSLNPQVDRLAVVTEIHLSPQADITQHRIYRARVRNKAKLAYDAVSTWLIGQGGLPEAAQHISAMDMQLRLQDSLAQLLRQKRHSKGALEFETIQSRAVFNGERVMGLEQQAHNRARQLIEEFMILANTCAALFLREKSGSSLRRVVREPERWQRIVGVANNYGFKLPNAPDSHALEQFLIKQRAIDPLRFSDLSLIIIKLMGSGEYVVERSNGMPVGHFGLAVQNYAHSTAPNRRYPDLVTQRMIKSWLMHGQSAYDDQELQVLALHCTQQEDAVRKVERRMMKSEAALVLMNQTGHAFDAVVTGKTSSGVWVRIFNPAAEGMLISQMTYLEVGALLRVTLVSVDVQKGFIDFAQIH